MVINHVEVLSRLAAVKEPILQPHDKDWIRVETELGVEFPDDFKDLVSCTGEGYFGSGLSLLNPVSTSEYGVLSHESIVKHFQLIADLKASANIKLYPEPFGAVIIAAIDREKFLLKPGSNDGRKLYRLLWWDIEIGELRELDMSISRFLHDLYFNLIQDSAVAELREYFWPDDMTPFFTQCNGCRCG